MKEIIMKELNLELNMIQDREIRQLAMKYLDKAPDYFWTTPASSTGKYHPSYALGEGGLLRHTKACCRIAYELFRNETVQSFTQEEKDLIIATLLLHDTCKLGVPAGRYTVTEHPLLIYKVFETLDMNDQEQKWANQIIKMNAGHMGAWCFDYKTKKEVLPKPVAKIERFIHMIDYLGSRKCLEFNFDAPLST